MKTRKIILALTLLLLIVFAVGTKASIVTAGYFDWSAVVTSETKDTADGAEGANTATTKKQGNGFVRALGAPFRALGRLFGGQKKKDQTLSRTTEKDATKFEAPKVVRIKDASIKPTTPETTSQATPTSEPATVNSTTASAFAMHVQRGRALLMAGNVDGAINELTAARYLNSKSAEANNLLGIAYESKGLRARALELFEVAVHEEENNAEHLNNLGFLLYKNGDYEKATKYLKRAVKLSPQDARIWNNLGLTQCQRGKFDDAYDSFLKAVGEFGAHMSLAAQFQSRGKAKEAIKHLEMAQALKPNSTETLTKLVALYELTGRPTDAENARRSLVALRTFADAKQ